MTSNGIRPKIPNLAKCGKGFDLHTFRDYFSDVQVRIHSVLCFILSTDFFSFNFTSDFIDRSEIANQIPGRLKRHLRSGVDT